MSSIVDKGKKGANWKEQLVIHKLKPDGSKKFSFTPDDMEAFDGELFGDLNELKLIRINYYRSAMPDQQRNMELTCLVAALIGVALIGGVVVMAIYLGPSAAVATAAMAADQVQAPLLPWIKALLATAGGCETASAAVTGICTKNIMFHGYLVIECSNGIHLSLEKNTDVLEARYIQEADHYEMITDYKQGGKGELLYTIMLLSNRSLLTRVESISIML